MTAIRIAKPSSVTGICRRVLNVDPNGVLGSCGATAIALNRALFGGSGRYLVMIERQLFLDHARWVGHVMVHHQARLYDANGEFDYRDYLQWLQMTASPFPHGTVPEWIPRMPKPEHTIRTDHADVICFWATDQQVIRAFVRPVGSNVDMLVRLFRYLKCHPRAALTPRHRTRFTDAKLEARYGAGCR